METEVGPVAETVSQSSVERTYIPTTQGPNNADSSVPEEASAFPASCAGGVVTTVTVSGRDPRTAMSSSSGIVTPALRSGPASDKVSTGETKQETSKPVMTVPKSILTKPSSSPDPRYLAVHHSPSIKCVYLIVSQATKCLMWLSSKSHVLFRATPQTKGMFHFKVQVAWFRFLIYHHLPSLIGQIFGASAYGDSKDSTMCFSR